jgi:hypothetical protein
MEGKPSKNLKKAKTAEKTHRPEEPKKHAFSSQFP